jgi:hypothetical protein
MSKKIIGRILLLLALIIVVGGAAAYAVLTLVINRPLGQPLSTPAGAPTEAAAPSSSSRGSTKPAPTEARPPTLPAPTATAEPPVTYMVLGLDRDQQAEAIYVMTADAASGEIVIEAYAPSLRVNVAGLEALGLTQTEFKNVYASALTLPDGTPGAAVDLMAQTLADNFDIVPDHYLSLNEADLAAQIDALGGLDVNVAAAFRNFAAGPQHLDGAAVWAYVAAIDQPGLATEAPRIERQKQVLQALLKKALSPAVIPSLPNLMRSALNGEVVQTDLSLSQLLALVSLLQQVPADDIAFSVQAQ